MSRSTDRTLQVQTIDSQITKDAYLDYLRHIKESVETIRDIVEEAKVPKSHVKPNRISPAKGVNKLPVEDQPRTNKSRLRTSNRIDSSSLLKRTDNFEGIQKSLTKEVKEMKDVFEELEAEVAQYAVDRKCDVIELKNLLIVNDNLIAECLSQEVFCVATNSELNVARFTEMHVANTTSKLE
nr:hypothetical protein [Tanacetum cinerariifolium]